MLRRIYKSPHRVRQLLSGPLGPHIGSFVGAELDQGFARLTLHEHLRVLGKLNCWLERHDISVQKLTAAHLQAFIVERHRRERPSRSGSDVLARFLEHLQCKGVTRAILLRQCKDALERLLDQFDDYLTRMRGLSRQTIARYTYLMRPFLKRRFGSNKIRLDQLRPDDLRSLITDTAHNQGRDRARDLVVALRAFLRWLQTSGVIDAALADSVPTVATWRLRGLPPTLSATEVRRMLCACDTRTAVGRRDRAILLLLARLGLRATEVVSLRLEDLDWRKGVLRIRRKGDRVDELPIPTDVGRAFVRYLQYGRPRCAEPRVFVCMVAPHRGLGHSATVSSIVAAALRRAGLRPAHRGAHLLRHTLASSLLRRGAPLSEIGQLLGHRSSASTEVYAKVDLTALRMVAHPWPGGRR